MRYNGLAVRELRDGPELVLFAAPAAEIRSWSGIPQRRRTEGGVETSGFQREDKQSRVRELSAFMRDPSNVIQNPLLAATQSATRVRITNRANDGSCTIDIDTSNTLSLSLLDLIETVKTGLVSRLPSLETRAASSGAVLRLRMQLANIGSVDDGVEGSSDEIDDDDDVADSAEDGEDPSAEDVASGLFQEETQVVDFYDELNARSVVLRELGNSANDLQEIDGFTRDYLTSLIQPVVIVDGQHRLLGALAAIEDYEKSEEGEDRAAELINEGLTASEARDRIANEQGRKLPVSLLVSDNPAEHVFQFVVVNQKATPMTNALLGTIVATSLTKEELEPIAQRLSSAGIQLESSQAVAFLSRSPSSPFRGLVSTGVTGDQRNALPWSVLLKLANIVRNLAGGVQYHPPRVDYPKLWKDNYLARTGLLSETLTTTVERQNAWAKTDGPWRGVFVSLHKKIRDKFGSDDSGAHSFWGSTQSNLYNMVSLHILTVDFFKFLNDKERALESWDDLNEALESWVSGLNSGYFDRNFRMGGTKKDQPRIKSAWSEAWAEFRTTKRLPRVERYNPGGQ